MTGIQQDCVGTTEEWEDENPLLAEGVRGLEITEDGRRYYKVGDGVKLWNDLPYLDKTMIRGLAEELDRIDLNRVPDNDVPEMDGEGSAGDPENWNYSRGDHRHPSDTSRVALESAVTQIIDSDIALSNGKKLLGVKKNAAQANLVSVGDYGTYEQIEVGTESDPLCLNHSAKAPDGTVTGKNILVNYKDTAGVNKADTVAYGSDVEALKRDMDAWIGRGGFLDEHDFETGTPTQEALTAYALSQIPTITDPLEIWNGTKIPNAYDNHVWILTNTQDTDPAVFEWTDQGVTTMVPFNEDIGGYIIGADTDDPDGTIESTGGGKGRPKGWDSLGRSLFDMEHPVGSTFTQEPWDLAPADRNWPGNWVNWSFRAWEYCLSQTAPSSAFIADWKQKRHDIWNLNTDGTV
ncbi:MAG: hypothetical protein LBC31_06950, partial [Treponema sp.]|nr:hypothetical protein [Treponema sp.]